MAHIAPYMLVFEEMRLAPLRFARMLPWESFAPPSYKIHHCFSKSVVIQSLMESWNLLPYFPYSRPCCSVSIVPLLQFLCAR